MTHAPQTPDGRLSSPQHGLLVEKDVAITARDGTALLADVFRPDAEGTFPALVCMTAYQKDLV